MVLTLLSKLLYSMNSSKKKEVLKPLKPLNPLKESQRGF